jgi:hypothetical protein
MARSVKNEGYKDENHNLQVDRDIFSVRSSQNHCVGQRSTIYGARIRKNVERHQIKHVKTPEYHSQNNGQAENFVKTFKQALKKNITENTNIEIELVMARFLLDYRNAIHAMTKVVSC